MSSFDMPAKREFRVIPSPQSVARFTLRAIVFLCCAGVLLVSAKFLWSYSFGGRNEVQAATPPPVKQDPAPVAADRPPAAAAGTVTLTDEQFERLRADVCRSIEGFVFEDGRCFKPKPKTWSAEGIKERGTEGHPLPEAGAFLKKFVAGLAGTGEQAQEYEPPPRHQAEWNKEGESCDAGRGLRDSIGMCDHDWYCKRWRKDCY